MLTNLTRFLPTHPMCPSENLTFITVIPHITDCENSVCLQSIHIITKFLYFSLNYNQTRKQPFKAVIWVGTF